MGRALAANVVGSYSAPPSRLPTAGVTDAAVAGNGDMAIIAGGASSSLRFYVGKADFFGVLRGSIMPVGTLVLNAPALSGSSYSLNQNVGPATITGSFANGSSGLSVASWVASSENTAVIQLTNTGSQALSLSSQLLDGFAGSAGNPATYGSATNSTWLNVSPDTVNLELGNQLYNVLGASAFAGRIADLRVFNQALSGATLSALDANGAPTPILHWGPSSPGTATLAGSTSVNASDSHGGSAVFDGNPNGEVLVGDLPLPENQFTFTTWINPAVSNVTGNIVTAQIPYLEIYGSGYPYPFVRGLTLRLVNGALSASLNQSGTLNSSTMLFVPDAVNAFSTTASSALPANAWTQVAVTYDGNVLKIFANGTQAGTTASFPTGTTNGVMGWNKMVNHLGDTSAPYNGCAPQGVLMQSVLGATATVTSQGNLSFTIPAGGQASIVLAAVTDRNNASYLAAAQTQSQQATSASLSTLKQTHDAWWSNFWSKSFVQIPDQKIQSSWYGSLYLLACCSTANAPPPGLWGNFSTSTFPAWQGDYTLNYNYESTPLGAMACNHIELSDNYATPLISQMSRGQAAAQYTFGSSNPGIYFYTHLIPAPGWSDDPGTFWEMKSNSLYGAVDMAVRWRYTLDTTYAAQVYPYLKGVADFWDNYLVLVNNQYVDYNDAVYEVSPGDAAASDTNCTMTLSYIRLVYPVLLQMSQALNVDADRRAKWNDIIARLTPLPIVPASSISQINSLGAPYNSPGVNVLRSSTSGTNFDGVNVTVYQDHQIRGSGAGQGSMTAIYPGWNVGLESDSATLQAGYNTIWLMGAWFDPNADNFSYAGAACIGFDPTQILSNLDTFLTYYSYSNFMIDVGNGGSEQYATTPGTLAAMFLQSYQTNIHVFADWPSNQNASFGNLTACGGFLISSAMTLGQVNYVQVQSNAGQMMNLVNPWPGSTVQCVSSLGGGVTLSGAVLNYQTRVGETLTLTSSSAASLTAPANLAASANGNAATLNWSAVSGASGYNIKRSTSSAGPYLNVATVTSGTNYSDQNLGYQTAYYYAVSAIAPGVESANSAIVPVTTLAPPPVLNASFENPAVADGSFENTQLPGWTFTGSGTSTFAIINPGVPGTGEPWTTTSPSGMDGLNFCQIYSHGAGGGGIVYQDTGIKYQAGVTYKVTAAFGLQPSISGQTLAPGCSLVLYNSSLNPIAAQGIQQSSLTSGAFADQSVAYTANGNEGGDVVIGFYMPTSAPNTYLDFDNVRLTALPLTYAAYQQQYFTQAQLQNAAISGPAADANGDGISNLMACALGLSPWTSASASLPQAVAQGGYLTISFSQNKSATNWTVAVEVSSDLVNWYSGSSYTTQTSVTSLDSARNLVTVTDNTPLSANTKRFMRLKVTLP
jgi:hypothetical protein